MATGWLLLLLLLVVPSQSVDSQPTTDDDDETRGEAGPLSKHQKDTKRMLDNERRLLQLLRQHQTDRNLIRMFAY